ncbi:diguanylate cyclase (GGDEF) domain-containing protein [Frankia sp. EI5c]|uniref:GGDEF domain-containing protein n=1 Tax=Frankia sp. EI5c TaxID=683316 RepID=UPI0007C322B5|nr:diguanylate cyclase [Frankia sp. EI5c]OAA19794.1 diguanylate cyclase (GGDEF) domain-containing protein [Frankia sp. EI5c]
MDGSGLRAHPLAWGALACGIFALLVVICMVVLPAPRDLQSVDVACAVATFALTGTLLVTARHAPPEDRLWRVLVGLTTLGGFGLGLLNGWYGLVHGADVYDQIKVTHAGFILIYLPALAGLLLLPSEPLPARVGPRGPPLPHGRHWYAITVLDSTLIVGSIALVAWSAILGPVAQRTSLNKSAMMIIFGATAVSLVLVVAAALLGMVRRPRSVRTLALLGAGLTVMSLTMAGYLHLAAANNGRVPVAVHLGYLFAWLLLLLAALVPLPPRPADPAPRPAPGPWVLGLRAALPYLAFGGCGTLILIRLATGTRTGDLELYALICLLVLLVGRQLATLGERARLLTLVEASRRELHHQAFHDPLTGVANRALFTERLEQAVAGHVRDGRQLAVLYCDIDDFKQINDSLGHAAGDTLLRVVAERLQRGTRPTDTVARLGGDEFAVVLDSASDDPEAVARRLARTLPAPCELAARSHPVGISLGLVIAGPTRPADAPPITADSMLRDADLAMYEAKSARQGGLVVRRAGRPTPAVPVVRPGGQLGGQLAAVLRGEPGHGTLDVDYRRVVDLGGGHTVARDVQVRWDHPQIGTITPQRLHELADRGGFGRDLDSFLLRRGFDDLVRGEVPPVLLVPFSAGRAVDDSLVTDIIDGLTARGIPPRAIIPAFSAAAPGFGDPAAARAVLGRLRDHGVRCALTDVAGDPTSLRLLRELPIAIVRLHGSLTGDCDESLQDGSLDGQPAFVDVVRSALVGAVTRDGLPVIVLGIRSGTQERRLLADGCRLGEGPYYDRRSPPSRSAPGRRPRPRPARPPMRGPWIPS